MNRHNTIKVIIAETDSAFAETLEKKIQHDVVKAESNLHFEIKHFNSAKACVDNIEKETDILLLDYNLDLSGTVPYTMQELLKLIFNYCIDCKVIIIADQEVEGVAVELFKTGIYAYVEKDENVAEKIPSVFRQAIKEKILDYYI